MSGKHAVLIADDHPAVRTGLGTILKSEGFRIIAEVATGRDAVAKSIADRPDIVLLDYRMPDGDGVWALEQIRKKIPNQRAIIMSIFSDRQQLGASAAIQANEYLLKDASISEIVAAVNRVIGDEPLSDSSLLRRVKRRTLLPKSRDALIRPRLTDRETQVLQHISHGQTNIEIGKALGISVETVKEHVANLIKKDRCRRSHASCGMGREGRRDLITLDGTLLKIADGEGFEPPVQFPVQQFSRLPP